MIAATPVWRRLSGRLVCPRCRQPLKAGDDVALTCASPACGLERFPIVDGTPVLLDPDVTRMVPPAAPPEAAVAGGVVRRARRAIRPLYVALATWSINFPQERHATLVADRAAREPAPRLVLVVGAGFGNTVVEALRRLPGTDAVSFDLRRADGVDMVADAHAIPLADGSVDVVVVQAVLEHVMDPGRVVAEIERVLRPGGLVYSDTPFLQPYHADPTDWQRFTLPGHRLLFHAFDEIESGTTGGPFMAVLWTFHEALRALFEPWPRLSAVARLAFRVGFSWMKYLDAIAIRRRTGATAASGTYFFGARRATRLDARERFDPLRWARERLDV
jgi:SAM-dependent methyltransferase/uncharacterized protein YbaR (Trm112 family)